MPYFLLGYTIANEDVLVRYKNEIFQKLNLVGYLVLTFIFIGWFIIITFRPCLTFATAFNDGYSGNINGLMLRIALQFTIVLTGYCILKVFPNKETFYTKYGKRTLYVYLLHGLVVLPFAYIVFPSFGVATFIGKILMILVPTLCCIFLFSETVYKYMSFLFGQKSNFNY